MTFAYYIAAMVAVIIFVSNVLYDYTKEVLKDHFNNFKNKYKK